jgi:imidazolonepropionase-like amidohydrolase
MAFVRSGFSLLCLGGSLIFSAPSAAAAEAGKTYPPPCAFVHANVIPVNEERLLSDQTVVVQNGTITQIGPSKGVVVPRGDCKINAKGKLLIP